VRTLVALLLFAAPLLAAPVPKALKAKPPASLDGRWKMESQEANGKSGPPSERDYNTWVVAGDTMHLVRDGDATKEGVYPCRFVSDPRDDGPRTFEYKVDQNGYHRRGVCELDGDTLRVAFSGDANTRPAAVQSSDTVTVYTFKRVPDTK
jgi:uncharacterized protein (TIGR03067 family)